MRKILAILTTLSIASLGFANTAYHVGSTKALKVVRVETTKLDKEVQTLFSTVFAAAIEKRLGEKSCPVPKSVAADQAAFGLETRSLDAIITFGQSLPRPLIASGIYRVTGELPSKKNAKVYLLIRDQDEEFIKFMQTAFSEAVNDEKFLATINAIKS